MAYGYFIFDKNIKERTLEKIQTILETHYLNSAGKPDIQLNDKLLTLKFNDYKFHFVLNDEKWIIEESKEIAEDLANHRSDKGEIAHCSTRIEFDGDDDFDMDYFNESLFILDELSKCKDYVILDYNHGTFYDEV
jgi:hypothetical protein